MREKKLLVFLLTACFLNVGANAQLTRTITFQNLCNEPIWIALTPTQIPGNNTTCVVDKDCLYGASCIDTKCVYPISLPLNKALIPWKLPAHQKDNPNDPATQTKIQVELQRSAPDSSQPDNIVYQYIADIGARTGCVIVGKGGDIKELICETGQCPIDSKGGCIGDRKKPSNHIILTLNNADVDTYDMNFVNGVNIPIGITPADEPVPVEPDAHNPLFWCGKSGFLDARSEYYKFQRNANNLIGCDWGFTLPKVPKFEGYDSTVFYTTVVYSGDVTCTSDSQCHFPDRCGFNANDTAANAVPKCGRPVAYNVMANICDGSYTEGPSLLKRAFGCYSTLGAMDAFKMQAYALCAMPPNAPPTLTVPPTCYTQQPSPECCGCIAWENLISQNVKSTCQIGDTVNGQPNFWQANIRDKVLWLSEHCLAATSYQFDDVHSTFSCSSVKNPSLSNTNKLNYVITFCPDGQRLFDTPKDEF